MRRRRSVEEALWAARVARLLRPSAEALGGFATSHLTVQLGSTTHHPAVAVMLAEAPCEGVVRQGPDLVIELGAGFDPAVYLAGGSRAVWSVGTDVVTMHLPDGWAQDCTATATAAVPDIPELTLAVKTLVSNRPKIAMRT